MSAIHPWSTILNDLNFYELCIYVFMFTAQTFSGDLKENDEGYLKWITDAELESLPLWPSDHIFLPWLRQEKFFSAKFIYEGEELLSHEVNFYSQERNPSSPGSVIPPLQHRLAL